MRRRNLIADDAYPDAIGRRPQIRAALASRVARPSRRDDELRRPARRAEKAARQRHLSRHRLCELHRGDQSVRRLLRRRRRAHHLAGRRDREARRARRDHRAHRRHRAGPGRRSRGGAMRRHRRSACRSTKCASITGDTDNTPYGGGTWASRAAGIGGEAAWQAGKALRANVLAVAGAMLQAKPGRSRYPQRHRRRQGQTARSACRSMSWRASPISVPTRCRPASRPN